MLTLHHEILLICTRLLISVDPETFASLSLLNRHWRRRSSTTLLYAYHLAKCTATGNDNQKRRWSEYRSRSLAELKRLFAQEAKRNLFVSYGHRRSTYQLVAPSTLSASAVPHGEAFSFFFALNGTRAAVCSSSRLFILDLCRQLPEVITAFTLRRRPTAVEISNDGQRIAVLGPEWRINTFDIEAGAVNLAQTFLLDESAITLAMSPDGSLLAAAQTHGIEFFALGQMRGTASRRKLACEPITSLKFAQNGGLLLGTNTRSPDGTTTIVFAPSHFLDNYGEDDAHVSFATLWLSQPLFPSSFGRTTHASLVPGNEENRIFAYDAPAERFGMLDHQKMKFTNSIMNGGQDQVIATASVPSLTEDGRLAALAVSGSGVQVIGLPLDDIPALSASRRDLPSVTQSRAYGEADAQQYQRWLGLDEKALQAQWMSTTRDIATTIGQRLVVVGSNDVAGRGHEVVAPDVSQDSGVLHCIDFGLWPTSEQHQTTTIDLSTVDAQLLEEGSMEDDAELTLMRQSLSSRASDRPRNAPLARSVTSARQRPRSIEKDEPRRSSEEDGISPEEQHLDAPYLPSEPRPQGTLLRNRTARAAHCERPRSMPIEPRMRDPRGRGEVPDESDADGWVPPPPVYAQEPDSELPDDLKRTLRPPTPPPKSPNRKSASTPNLLSHQASPLGESHAEASGGPVAEPRPHAQRRRTFVDSARKSAILSRDGLRRITSGPFDLFSKKGDRSDDRTVPKDPADEISHSSSDENKPPPARARHASTPPASQERRRSFFGRPLSLHTNLRDGIPFPSYNRTVSQPLERTSTPPFTPAPVPDSPTLPSPAQVASLHRRQTSGSISSLQSENITAPRAAAGAHRRGTNSMSPWSSTLMLNTVKESNGGDAATSQVANMHISSSPGPSRPLSMHMTNTNTPSNNKPHRENSSNNNRPPTRLQEASMESSRASSRGKRSTSDHHRRRSFIPQSTRLSAIPSMASLKAFTSHPIKRSDKSPSNRGVGRSGSRKLQRGDSVRKRESGAKEKESVRKRLGQWAGMVMKNLEKV